jgi:hypothetical protein
VTKEYEEAENQREMIMKELVEFKHVLGHIQVTQAQDRGEELIPRSTEEGDKTVHNEEETIQLIA